MYCNVVVGKRDYDIDGKKKFNFQNNVVIV